MIEFLVFTLGLLMLMERRNLFKIPLGLIFLFKAGDILLVKYAFLNGNELGYALAALGLGLEGFLVSTVAFYIIEGVEW